MADEQTGGSAAATPVVAQPAATAAASDATSAVTTPETTVTQATDTTVAQPSTSERLWAGRYKTPEEMERGMAESTREALRLYEENKQLRDKGTTGGTTTSTTPQYTEPQLSQFKTHWQNEYKTALSNGDTAAAAIAFDKFSQCSDLLVEARISRERQGWQSQQAASSLAQESANLIKPYQNDLHPGNPLYDAAAQEYQKASSAFLSMLPPGTQLTPEMNSYLSAVSVITAAARTGKMTAGVEQKARQDLAGALQQTMKQAVVAGAGSTAKTDATIPDFDNMTREQFAAYRKRELGLVV